LLDVQPRRGPQPAQVLALLALHIVLLALLGQVSGDPKNRRLFIMDANPDAGLALPTALYGAVLCMGILASRPDVGFMAVLLSRRGAGVVTRRLLLLPIVIPFAVGSVVWVCQRTGLMGLEFSGWLFGVVYFGAFTAIIWWVASVVHVAETERA